MSIALDYRKVDSDSAEEFKTAGSSAGAPLGAAVAAHSPLQAVDNSSVGLVNREAQIPLSKALMDRTVAALGLLALSPLFAMVTFLIKRDGGPAFYVQHRVGRNGEMFRCWKFRSMVPNAEAKLREVLENNPAMKAEWETTFKLKEDPRVTKIGTFLRKTSMDELPQLWNVLRGEMSLVGPRPILPNETIFYGEVIHNYTSVNPGMTGTWQISGRSDVSFQERVALDLNYIRNRSFWGDVGIILKTIPVMLFGKGAY